MRPFLIATMSLALAACESSPPAPPLTTASAANPNAQVCHHETPTGSNVWHNVCVTPHSADSNADADNQRGVSDLQNQVQHSPAGRPGTGS